MILTQPRYSELEKPCLSSEPMKSGIELVCYVHSRTCVIQVEKENANISCSGNQCVGPPPVTETHEKQEKDPMRLGPFTRQTERRCMSPHLLGKVDVFPDLGREKNAGWGL